MCEKKQVKDASTEDKWPTFVALLNDRARQQPDQPALGFLTDGETTESWRSFRELDEEARAIGGRLRSTGHSGQAALLLYRPGLDFVSALLGCLYGGVVAVPVPLPHHRRPLTRLEAIAADSGALTVLTTRSLLTELEVRFQRHPVLGKLRFVPTDDVDPAGAEAWEPPEIDAESVACLQYTSGSTADPKGVVLTHGNLLFNSQLIHGAFRHDRQSVGVMWLPPYHDMGLIGGILQPIFGGFRTLLLSPAHVVQEPLRWLRAITRFRATTSGGPNFIYESCISRIAANECGSLDLSSWRVAFNGAEPIRAETLERFAEKFGPYGFRREAFLPCYGLAEATLFVSGEPQANVPLFRDVSKEGLKEHHVAAPRDSQDVLRVVGCGRPAARKSW